MLTNRNIVTCIVLSIVTCGIYGLYWTYKQMDELDREGGASNLPVIVQFILLWFYVGFILYGLNADANVNAIKEKRGLPTTDNKVLYIVLGLVFPIALLAIVQKEINDMAV